MQINEKSRCIISFKRSFPLQARKKVFNVWGQNKFLMGREILVLLYVYNKIL